MIAPSGDDTSIADDDTVLRRVPETFTIYDNNLLRNRPSSQAFLQDGPDGLVSVYLSSETSPEAVASGGPERFLASVKVGGLRAQGLGIVRDPSTGGPGHCVITGRKTKGRLNQVVRMSAWVESYAPE